MSITPEFLETLLNGDVPEGEIVVQNQDGSVEVTDSSSESAQEEE